VDGSELMSELENIKWERSRIKGNGRGRHSDGTDAALSTTMKGEENKSVFD
jgi:hypothetical protein